MVRMILFGIALVLMLSACGSNTSNLEEPGNDPPVITVYKSPN